MILRFEKRTVNVHLVTSSHTTTTTVTTTIIDRTGSDSRIRVAQIGITVVLALFTIYSRTQIREEIRWFDGIERGESSVSKNVEFLKELVSETLVGPMPALLRGVQFR